MKLKNNTETGFHTLKLKSKFREGGYFVDASFVNILWEALATWFIFIAQEKRKQHKKPLLRIYDLRTYAPQLQNILMKGGKEK